MGITKNQVDDLGVITMTWEEISDALSCNGTSVLIPGRYYKIDFRSTFYIRKGDSPTDWATRGMPDGPPAYETFCTDLGTYGSDFLNNNTWTWLGPLEELLLLATDYNKVSSDVISVQFPNDTIHWEPMSTDSRYYKGKITYRKDNKLNLSTHYDWRAIKFRRWNRTLETTIVNPLSTNPVSNLIELPVEIGSLTVENSELNKFTSWFEADPLMSIGRNNSIDIDVIGMTYLDYFTFGGCVTLDNTNTNTNINIDEAANQPVNNSTPFYWNVPKDGSLCKFKNIYIGKVKQQVLCGVEVGQLPTILTAGCSGINIIGSESGSFEPCTDASNFTYGDNCFQIDQSLDGENYSYNCIPMNAYGNLSIINSSGSGSGSGAVEIDQLYYFELNNIIFLEPTTVYETQYDTNNNITGHIPMFRPCENVIIEDGNLRGTIDGQGCKNITIGSGFESNIIISNQPNNDPTYIASIYETYTDINQPNYGNVKSFISTNFQYNNIGVNFKFNLIQIPFLKNSIGDNFMWNKLFSDPVWYNWENKSSRKFKNNIIHNNFIMNDITQEIDNCEIYSNFSNNIIKSLYIIPGDNLGRKIDSTMSNTRLLKSDISYIDFTLIDESQIDVMYKGMLKSLSNRYITDISKEFKAGSSFETGLLYPQDLLEEGVINFNNKAFEMIGELYLKPNVIPNVGDTLPLNKIEGTYIPKHNINITPISYRIKNINFIIDGSTGEFVKKYDILDNSIDVYSLDEFYYPITTGLLSNNIIIKPFTDHQNRIWFGHLNGVTLWDPSDSSWITYNSIANLGGTFNINCIIEDSSNRIWIGHDNGVSVYDNGIWYWIRNQSFVISSVTYNKNHFDNSNVNIIFEDKIGRIWIGTDEGVSVWTTNYTLAQLLTLSLLELNKTLVICNNSITISSNTYSYFTVVGSNTHIVTKIYQDTNNNIYLGTNGNGVSMVENGILTIANSNQAAINFIKFTNITATNNRNFSHLSSSIVITSIFEDSNNDVWFTTTKGVSKRSINNQWIVYDNLVWNSTSSSFIVASHLPDLYVYVGFVSKNEDVWFLTDAGLSKYNSSIWSIYNTAGTHYVSSATFQLFFEDSKGNIWFASNEPSGSASILQYNDGTFTLFDEIGVNFVLGSGRVSYIYEDTNNNIWFGNQHGSVSQYDGIISWDVYTISSNFPNYPITYIFEDLSTSSYIDWVLGLNSINTNKLTDEFSTVVDASDHNISLATDILDLWTRSMDWVQLGRRFYLNDTIKYDLSYAYKVYDNDNNDVLLDNYEVYTYTSLSTITKSNILENIENLYLMIDSTYLSNNRTMMYLSEANMMLLKTLEFDREAELNTYIDTTEYDTSKYNIIQYHTNSQVDLDSLNIMDSLNSAFILLSSTYKNKYITEIFVSPDTLLVYFTLNNTYVYNGVNLIANTNVLNYQIFIVSIIDANTVERISINNEAYKSLTIIIEDISDSVISAISVISVIESEKEHIFYQISGQNNYSI